ncbi:hypothetical protein [Capnocytophaga canis]|uniref:hypothetical protein n=1 Tax=Capnocytophaga canis TaxID=1848903 RepID=UPI003859B93E
MGQYVEWDIRYDTGTDLGFEYYKVLSFGGLVYKKTDKDGNEITDGDGNPIYEDTDSFKTLVPEEKDRNNIKNAKGLNVGSSTDRVGLILENSNSGAIKLKRENNYKKIFFSSIEYNRYDVQIYGAYNYNIDVYLKKTSTYGEAIPIKFVTKKYKILKNKKDYLELQPPNGTILKLKKVEKGFYSDDPFE